MAGMGSDDDGYDELFRREHAGIVRTAHLIVGDVEVAREVAQEAFARLYQHWPKVSRYDRPGAWVRRVAIRLAVKAAKRDRRIDRGVDVTAVRARAGAATGSGSGGPADPGGRPMLDVDVLAALTSLPAQQRAALALAELDDLSTSEVAEILGCSDATVRVHLRRARARMATLLTSTEENRSDAP
jgi:RNA polymerase sigma-70 factor (ECF subfamily)